MRVWRIIAGPTPTRPGHNGPDLASRYPGGLDPASSGPIGSVPASSD